MSFVTLHENESANWFFGKGIAQYITNLGGFRFSSKGAEVYAKSLSSSRDLVYL
jgi:hypothetical protein